MALAAAGAFPTLAADKPVVVGFSQIGAESAWRTANTESIKSEAAKRGIDLKFADAQQKQENQIKALRSFIAQMWTSSRFRRSKRAGNRLCARSRRRGFPLS